jgi:hypothetical protein
MRESDKARDARAPYAGYDVLAKWRTPSFDDRTREVLAARLNEAPPRRFLTPDELSLLDAVVERLAPPLPGLEPRLLALWIDDRLHQNLGEGFRGPGAPPLQQCWRLGLAGVDAEARRRFETAFADLAPDARDETLRAIEHGDIDAALWGGLDAASFFTDTLSKTVAGLAYAHPSAWSDIGFGGPASPRGYVRLGFDARDPWEARERR